MRLITCESSILKAAEDMRYLLGRFYDRQTALSIVCKKYKINKLQQKLLFNGVYDDKNAYLNRSKLTNEKNLIDANLNLDLYNVASIINSGLFSEILLFADDGYLRNINNIYNKNNINLIEYALEVCLVTIFYLKIKSVKVFLDPKINKNDVFSKIINAKMKKMNINGNIKYSKIETASFPTNQIVVSSNSNVIQIAKYTFDLPHFIFKKSMEIKSYSLK